MYYQLYEWNHALLSPARALNDAVRLYYKNPLNPLCYTELGRQIAAAGDVFERLTRRYGKPEFGIATTEVDGETVRVEDRVVWERPFCRLLHFHRERPEGAPKQPNLVIVAPMSGHYATLLRGTVAAMLPHFEVYITDWVDARMVPLAMGPFNLDDYIDYMIDIVHYLRGDCHLMAVCQPAVPVFAATALLEADDGAYRPKSITLMGGPIDTRENPTEVNAYAEKRDLDWFRRNVIMTVPLPHPGFLRQVYPGFLQLSGFMAMNLDRHLSAHYEYFDHLVKGDGDSAEKHRDFYDEYLSVMDLTAEFFLQTVDTVFLHHRLPKGEMMHRRRRVDPSKIRRTPIFTVEGENDDISGLGQTRAAHDLTPQLPQEKHQHYMQEGVGHYGVFNGSRFRREIAPRIADFVTRWNDEDTRPAYTAARGGNGRSGRTAFAAAMATVDAAAKAAEAAARATSETVETTAEATFSAAAEAAAPSERATAAADVTAPEGEDRAAAPAEPAVDPAPAAPEPAARVGDVAPPAGEEPAVAGAEPAVDGLTEGAASTAGDDEEAASAPAEAAAPRPDSDPVSAAAAADLAAAAEADEESPAEPAGETSTASIVTAEAVETDGTGDARADGADTADDAGTAGAASRAQASAPRGRRRRTAKGVNRKT